MSTSGLRLTRGLPWRTTTWGLCGLPWNSPLQADRTAERFGFGGGWRMLSLVPTAPLLRAAAERRVFYGGVPSMRPRPHHVPAVVCTP